MAGATRTRQHENDRESHRIGDQPDPRGGVVGAFGSNSNAERRGGSRAPAATGVGRGAPDDGIAAESPPSHSGSGGYRRRAAARDPGEWYAAVGVTSASCMNLATVIVARSIASMSLTIES